MTRPYIGPKAQAAVPEEVHNWVADEMERRGERNDSALWRELILRGYAAVTGTEVATAGAR